MAKVKISQLPELATASLDVELVGSVNGTTYKISVAALTASVVEMLSESMDSRLDFLEEFQSDFYVISASIDTKIAAATNEQSLAHLATTQSVNNLSTSVDTRLNILESFSSSADNRYVLSGSITQTTWDNIANKPNDIISSSTQISDLGFVTGSYTTINEFNNLTQSFTSISQSFTTISSSVGGVDFSGINAVTESYLTFTQSYYNESSSFSSRIEAATNEQYISQFATTSSLNDLSTSLDSRIDILETFSASADNRYILSGSITQTTWDNINGKPNDIISSSTQITSLGFISESTDISSLNLYTASLKNAINVSGIGTASVTTIYGNLHIEGVTTTTSASNLSIANNFIYLNDSSSITDPDLGIVGNYNDGTYAHSGFFSDASDGHKWKVFKGYQPEPSQSIDTNDASFQLADFAANNLYGNLYGNVYATNGILSSSLGFVSTASYNSDSASFSSRIEAATNEQYLSGFATTGSNTFIGTEIISGSLLLSGSFSYNGTPLQNGFTFAQPQLTRILDNASYTGASAWTTSYTGSGGAIIVTVNVSGYRSTGGLGTVQLLRDGVAVASQTFYFNIANYHTPLPPVVYTRNSETGSHTYSIYFSNILADTNDYATINVLEYGNSAIISPNVISGSGQISSLGFITGSYLTSSTYTTFSTSVDSRLDTLEAVNMVAYLTTASYTTDSASFNSRIISGSAVAGTISSSAQISAFGYATTSSVTTISASAWGAFQSASSYSSSLATSISASNYTITINSASVSSLSSSFNSRINNITSSVSINTGSFVTTSSFNAFTASAQMVTTGSNSFNGTQTITGSLIITTGSFIGSQIVANTSSLYLTSGSNMYVQNNGLVEITGSLIVSGSANFNVNVLSVDGRSGDEGGEINLAIPVTNTSLENRVQVDIWQNRFRVFEGSANAKGVFVDLSKAPTGVNGEITWKVSGYVNAGTFVQLDNVKVTIPTSGNRGASIGAVSTSFTANISATFGNSAGTGGNAANTVSYTTTAAASAFGWNFGAAGDAATYILNDTTNSRVYRIITMIGTSYNNNFISIERLH